MRGKLNSFTIKYFFTNCINSDVFQMVVIRNTMISHRLPKQRWIQGRLFPLSPVFQQSWQRHGNKEDFMRWVVMVMTWLCGKIDSNIIETEQLRWHLWFSKGCLYSFFLVFFYHFFRWLKNFGGMASLANAAPRWAFHPWDIILKRNLQRKWSRRCFFRFKLIPCWEQTTGSPTQ